MSREDVHSVRRCLEGDTDAYGDLVARYQDAVYATAYYYVGRYGVAEDVSQDAFLAAYRGLPHLNDPTRFGPWLREITSRTAANWLRNNGIRIQNETPLPHRRTIPFDQVAFGPGDAAEQAERFEHVQRAIDALPEQYRLPVVLRYLQEMSYDDIAEYTGKGRDEIRGILQRASGQLRAMLHNEKRAEQEEQG